MRTFISFEEAQALVLETVPIAPIERKALAESSGLTLARSYKSVDQLPPFDNSAMDGFAVRLRDVSNVPVTLLVQEEIPAGTQPQLTLEPGCCARIMTGAPLPEGADAIVPVEWTARTEDPASGVVINRRPTVGAHIRRIGDDIQPGVLLLSAGSVVTPAAIGVLAGQGFAEVEVYRPPKVAVIATGDELVEINQPIGQGRIRNSNGPSLAAQVRSADAEPMGPFLARDNPESLQEVFQQASEADVWVISGGVSVGDYDYVKQELDRLGYQPRFWKVRQRPGKPLTFGYLNNKPVFGLPGNPVSSAMCFEQYVRPLLYKMMGRNQVVSARYPGVLTADVHKKADLHYFMRGIATYSANSGFTIVPSGGQGSHVYSAMLRANCMVHLPVGMENPATGTQVEFEWLPWEDTPL